MHEKVQWCNKCARYGWIGDLQISRSVPNVRDFKIQDPVLDPQKKISVPFCPNISGQNGSVLGSSGNFKSDKTERIFG